MNVLQCWRADPDVRLGIDPVAGCTTIMPDEVVYDEPRIRRLALPNFRSDYRRDLTNAIRLAQFPVKLRGITGKGSCSVSVLWATAPRQ